MDSDQLDSNDPPVTGRIKRSTPSKINSLTKPKKAAKKLRRSNSASTLTGLSVVLNPKARQYFISKDNFIGYRVLVHSPYSFAEVAGKGFAVGQNREVFIGVGAQLTESTSKVRQMSIQKRQCIQHDESLEGTGIKIETFSNYSRPSCLLECRAKILYKNCRCLPYYFPNFAKAWKRNTDCDLQGLQCIANSSATLSALSVDANFQAKDDLLEGANCYCPIDCTETVYNQEMSHAKLMDSSRVHKLVLEEYSVAKKLKKLTSNATFSLKKRQVFGERLEKMLEDITLVHIYFKELGIVKYSRDQLYSVMDVIAAFGGIVGLCMGFSLLSGAELIYFFTLRMFVDRQKNIARSKNRGRPSRNNVQTE
ncbi:hypothetical protein TCAL_16470 [Tigriopus californicus]|uniref:Amiloride-sensitive sodium channel n=3 Tax=Tigriopus californicus TaxID=6832 RepID=A0A553NS03_TIGCA|nr:hypothetical protein TCAL_16470 [Tigriopus californicus]